MCGPALRSVLLNLPRKTRTFCTRPLQAYVEAHAGGGLRGLRPGSYTSTGRSHGSRWNSTTRNASQGVVVVRNSRETHIETLIETLPSVPEHGEAVYDALFLFSRGLAPYATDPALFLRPAICKLLQNMGQDSLEVNVLAAAIDQVPSNSTSTIIATHEHPNCSEGVAFHISPSSNGSSLWRPSQITNQEHALDRRRGGIVSFSVSVQSHPTIPNEPHPSLTRDAVFQTPLASTVFQTGQQSTLFSYRFSRDQTSQDFHNTESSNLQSAIVWLPPPTSSRPTFIFNAPLERLTDIYSVRASMGNIVRSVDVPNGQDSTGRPASQDLEQAISKFFSTSGITPQPVSAYALVIPRQIAQEHTKLFAHFSGSAIQQPQAQSLTLLEALQVGARLHRVVSGGGGWGKKAGLLALDPEISFDGTNAGQITAIESILGPSEDYALHNVAASGDLICFFIDVESVGEGTSVNEFSSPSGPKGHIYVFGTVPSTIDDLDGGSISSGKGDSVEYVEGLFGAISESGMAYQEVEESASLTKAAEGDCKTRVDVPYARFLLT